MILIGKMMRIDLDTFIKNPKIKTVGLEEKLKTGKKLKIKLGFDPTSSDLHLGHYMVLKAARAFQDAGHEIIIIVGDFTASIGDPTGRNALRPVMTQEDIAKNAKTYTDQACMVLDKAKTKIVYNSTWLGKLGPIQMIKLMSQQTVSQVLQRDDFKTRLAAQTPIFLHEMCYPLMQGYDSVAIGSDVELGGQDQTFNLMVGRDLQEKEGQSAQAVLTMPILTGLDGVQKMSKSLKNYIAFMDTPQDKFGKVMSVSDKTMFDWLEVLFDYTPTDIEQVKSTVENPKDIKLMMARKIVEIFHGKEISLACNNNFEAQFADKVVHTNDLVVQEVINKNLAKLIRELELAQSVTDAGRKIEQGGVKVDSTKILDKNTNFNSGEEFILHVGKLNVKKVRIK